MVTGRRFYQVPNEVGKLLEDHAISAKTVALVVWVGTKYEGAHGGFKTNKRQIASVLDGCSLKTVQRVLLRASELHLLHHDLRQGQRSDFTIALGPLAVVDPATLDRSSASHVQSHFGQGVGSNGADSQSGSGVPGQPTLDSRARKSLGEELSGEASSSRRASPEVPE